MVAGLKKKWGWEEKRVAERSKGTGTGWDLVDKRSNCGAMGGAAKSYRIQKRRLSN